MTLISIQNRKKVRKKAKKSVITTAIQKILSFLLLFAILTVITSNILVKEQDHQLNQLQHQEKQQQQQQQYESYNGRINNLSPTKSVSTTATTTAAAAATSVTKLKPNGSTSTIILAGMIIDTTNINDKVISSLSVLNCDHHVHIHILTKGHNGQKNEQLDDGSGLESLRNDVSKRIQQQRKNCANIVIDYDNFVDIQRGEIDIDKSSLLRDDQQRPKVKVSPMSNNRIDKLSLLRDYQRSKVKEMYLSESTSTTTTTSNSDEGIIIVSDLDLIEFPNLERLTKQISQLKQKDYIHTAICANGVIKRWNAKSNKDERFYYDTFATIFLPNHSLLKTKNKLITQQEHGEGHEQQEHDRIIESNIQKMNQNIIYKYIKSRGKESTTTGNFSVKSCFGGMTIYKAKTYFNTKCQYELDENIKSGLADIIGGTGTGMGTTTSTDTSISTSTSSSISSSIMRYASKKEKRPCEHVVFHDCLQKNNANNFDIAINPKLITLWKKRL